MSSPTLRPATTRRAPAARFSLEPGEWMVLRSALLAELPGTTTPQDFTPAAFGREDPLTELERRRAWKQLVGRRLAMTVPQRDHLDALLPPFAAGLLALAHAEVQVSLRSWWPGSAECRSIAWCPQGMLSLSRCRPEPAARRTTLRHDGTSPGPGAADSTVELSMAATGTFVPEVLEALPAAQRDSDTTPAPTTTPAPSRTTTPVRLSTTRADAVADALAAGDERVIPHLRAVAPEALAALGAKAALAGGTQVAVYAPDPASSATGSGVASPASERLAFSGVWLWTHRDVVEVVRPSIGGLDLHGSSTEDLRLRVLGALADLMPDN